jgi:hypothetical protein
VNEVKISSSYVWLGARAGVRHDGKNMTIKGLKEALCHSSNRDNR